MERDCSGGTTAEGRTELLELDEDGDEVRLEVGVRPVSGDATCQGNPWTPFSVDLADPLGDREVVDIGPERPTAVTVDDRVTPAGDGTSRTDG